MTSEARTPPSGAPAADNPRTWRPAQKPGTDDTILGQLQLVGLLARQAEQRLSQSLGLNPTDFSALEHLVTDGPLTSRELADRLRVSTAASTHIVDRLERAGHITRRPHDSDRRKILVVPVAASKDRLFGQLRPMLEQLDAFTGGFGEADRQVIASYLSGVVDIYISATDAMGSS